MRKHIEIYLISDYPEYNEYIRTNEHSAGVDLFIGHKDHIHKGYGVHIMKEFLNEYFFTNPQVDKCIRART